MKIIKYILPLVVFFFSCSPASTNVEDKTVLFPPKIEPKDFYKFKHLLPESNYFYKIEVTKIEFEVNKDVFSITQDKYDVPTKIDGLTLTLKFKMTNPYNKAMQIPFPDYFYVTSEEFNGLKDFGYFKGCRCYSSSMNDIKNSKGKSIDDFTTDNNDGISRQRLIQFEANEVQEFTVKFTEPFPKTVKKIAFVGFNQHLYEKVDFSIYEKMSEAEREATRATSYSLVIDVVSKKIIGRDFVKR